MTTETIRFAPERIDHSLDFVPGSSAPMAALNSIVASLAQSNIPVLIVGESGVGKDLYAFRLHQLSPRASDPFEKIACGASEEIEIREKLYSITHAPAGAITPGTLFLDGVHELGPALQRHLLALLDSNSTWSCRIVSSAPTAIERDVETGRFRKELYFRLKGARLRLPSLRERREDVPILLEYFLTKHIRGLDRCALVIGQTELEALVAYDWPGNVRELENLAKKMIAVGSTQIDKKDFPSGAVCLNDALEPTPLSPLKVAARKALRRTERELILDALTRTHWNRKKAAQALQISYKSLLYKIKQIGAEQEETVRLERS
jgi:two-component system response regulator AtoC